jgi:ankyrin repeat protein
MLIAIVVFAAHSSSLLQAQTTTDFMEQVQFMTAARVALALQQGADIGAKDPNGRTPLMWAAEANQDPDVIAALVAAGAEVTETDRYGTTALMLAAEYNPNPAIINALITAGTRVNARDDGGRTALMYACAGSTSSAVVTALLSGGADTTLVDASGKGPVDLGQGNSAIDVSALITAGSGG